MKSGKPLIKTPSSGGESSPATASSGPGARRPSCAGQSRQRSRPTAGASWGGGGGRRKSVTPMIAASPDRRWAPFSFAGAGDGVGDDLPFRASASGLRLPLSMATKASQAARARSSVWVSRAHDPSAGSARRGRAGASSIQDQLASAPCEGRRRPEVRTASVKVLQNAVRSWSTTAAPSSDAGQRIRLVQRSALGQHPARRARLDPRRSVDARACTIQVHTTRAARSLAIDARGSAPTLQAEGGGGRRWAKRPRVCTRALA